MRMTILLPAIALGLTACVDVHHERPPAQASTTVVTPQPQTTYVAPATPGATTTVEP